jgi:hypothetical protein
MNNWAKVAAAMLAVALAGCAGTNGGNGATARTVAGSGTMYCMDGKLHAAEGGYRCTWAKSVKEACDATETVVIKTDSIVSGPTRGGMCAHGDRVVHVVLK